MKDKKNIISEDLKKFRLLSEYDFYVGEEEEVVEPKGSMITEEPPEDGEPEGELPAEPEGDAEMGDEEAPVDGEEIPDGELEGGEEFGDELPEPEPMGDEGFDETLPPEPMEDEVEVDITQLVQSSEETKAAINDTNSDVNQLMAQIDKIGQSLDKMDGISAKIGELENELEKRNPTPDEQLEMRSLDSFPYNLKLTDYWSEKEGQYDVMKQENSKDEEYTLTQDEVDRDYNEIHVKDSFSESDPYEDDDTTEEIKY